MFSWARHWISPDGAQALRAAPFALFLVLGLSVALAREPVARRRRLNALLAALLVFQALVAATQVDAWPFSPHRLMAADVRRRDAPLTMIVLRGVDSAGRQWRIDPLAWSPLYGEDIAEWFESEEPRAAPDARDAVMRFLDGRAEEARRLRAAGRRVGNEKWLGPLAAPDIFVAPRPGGFPAGPFAALRVYRLSWQPLELTRNPDSVERRMLLEYRTR